MVEKLIAQLFLMIIVLAGCATVDVHQPIQRYRLFEQPVAQRLSASVGSTVVRMNRQSDLPNIYGGKDIYGGKVDRGFVEVKLVSVSGEELTLSVSDIHRQSSETTMDRYVARPSVNVSQTVSVSSSGREGLLVRLNAGNEKEYVVGGVKITFREVRSSSVVYQIDDVTPVQNK